MRLTPEETRALLPPPKRERPLPSGRRRWERYGESTSACRTRTMPPRMGGSAEFRAFIRDELMPVVNARYRTSGETAIVGESLAGLFLVETLLVEPALFGTYLAVDPSLWWDSGRLVDTALGLLNEQGSGPRTLYLASSSEPRFAGPTAHLAGLLSGGARWIEMVHAEFPQETLGTIHHPAALQGFRAVLSGSGSR